MTGVGPSSRTSQSTRTIAPTLSHSEDGAEADPKRELKVLKVVYAETCQAWRTLTTIRFQILSFFLTASTVALVYVVARADPSTGLSSNEQLAIGALGLIVSVALALSEMRNTSLYNHVVRRGKQIEEELGIDVGVFRGRTEPRGPISYGFAATLIYGAAIAGWLLVGLHGLFPQLALHQIGAG